jgi:hypothetical protein
MLVWKSGLLSVAQLLLLVVVADFCCCDVATALTHSLTHSLTHLLGCAELLSSFTNLLLSLLVSRIAKTVPTYTHSHSSVQGP